MKMHINSWNIGLDSIAFRKLQEEALERFDETGLFEYQKQADYYGKLVSTLTDLAWHYECLTNEGIIEGL